jgi:hypothetical protein
MVNINRPPLANPPYSANREFFDTRVRGRIHGNNLRCHHQVQTRVSSPKQYKHQRAVWFVRERFNRVMVVGWSHALVVVVEDPAMLEERDFN